MVSLAKQVLLKVQDPQLLEVLRTAYQCEHHLGMKRYELKVFSKEVIDHAVQVGYLRQFSDGRVKLSFNGYQAAQLLKK